MGSVYSRKLHRDAAALGSLIVSLFLLASLAGRDPADPPTENVYPVNAHVQNWCGPIGARAAYWSMEAFGYAAYVLPLAAFGISWSLFRQVPTWVVARRAVGYVLVLLTATALFLRLAELAGAIDHPSIQSIVASVGLDRCEPPVTGAGGAFGLVLSHLLDAGFSRIGSTIILLPLVVAGYLMTADPIIAGTAGLFLRGSYRAVRRVIGIGRIQLETVAPDVKSERKAPPKLRVVSSDDEDASDESASDEEEESAPPVPSIHVKEHPVQGIRIMRTGFDAADVPIRTTDSEGAAARPLVVAVPPVAAPHSKVRLPDLEILDDAVPIEFGDLEQEIRERAVLLEKTFAEFQMSVKVVQIDTGPVVTQYEIELEPGLRARKVMAMPDDLAIALRASSVRIVAPIPGKNTVGIEVPNERRAKVSLKEVFTKAPASAGSMRLPLYLGKDVKGQTLVFDLANMPHLLIAGRTGTGKSVCLNALILSILMCRTPDQVKMLMIDPKMVELSLYKDIPHLLHPVVTDMRKAEALLCWAVEKMEERYDLLSRVQVRHIDSYNKLSIEDRYERLGIVDAYEKSLVPDHMPYILIFVDEMADLMMTAAKEVESHIIRLAQKARAVGIHLVLATQKPTVDVITGLIKSNLPARIAFQVASRVDSAVVLDEKGAEKLLGNGDMLFLYPGTSKIIRAQGTFVSDEEVSKVTAYLCSQAAPQYSAELMQLKSSSQGDAADIKNLADRDPMYEQAIDVVVREQRGSVSLLQRVLGIGYGRGARLIDYMAEDGIVGLYNGSQAREVLYTTDQWEELKRTRWGKAG